MPEKLDRKWGKKRSDDIIDIMDKISEDLASNFEVVNEEARKILKEASTKAPAGEEQ